MAIAKDCMGKQCAWQFPDDATPNFICDSNTAIFRLSNDVSFIPVVYLEHGQPRGSVIICPALYDMSQ